MNKMFVLLAAILSPIISSASASMNEFTLTQAVLTDFAQPPGGPNGAPTPLPPDHPCVKLNLSEVQKDTIKEMVYQSEQKHAQTEADVKKALLNLGHTFTSMTSTKADGAAAQTLLMAAASSDIQVKAELDLSVNYDVLHADQRENAFLCLMFMRAHQPKPGQGGGPQHP